MTDIERPDEEPVKQGEAIASSPLKGRRAFTNLRRELSDEELCSPAIQRLLIDDIERLEKEKYDLMEYQNRFHDVDKKAAILGEKAKANVAADIIFGVCLTVGAAALAYAPSIWSNQPMGWITIAFGVALIFGGIASKVVRL